MTLNNFVFNCTHYLQTMGYAKGSRCAPSYVSIVMANFEAKHIYQYIKEVSLLYLRYIDDIFMIWKGTKSELMTFIKELNKKHKTIKFEFQIPPRKIAFLDTMLYKDKDNSIQTTFCRKPTDEPAFSYAKSEQPRSLKNSIPYRQTLRLKTICYNNYRIQ